MVATVRFGATQCSREGRVSSLENSLCAALDCGRDMDLREEVSRGRAMAGHLCIKHQRVEIVYLALSSRHVHEVV